MISTIIVSRDRPYVLYGLLINVLSQTTRVPMEIIVSVDEDDPQRATYHAMLAQLVPIAAILRPEVALHMCSNATTGLVEAKNAALNMALGEAIMMLDDDLLLGPGYIQALYDDLVSKTTIGAVSGYITSSVPAISHTQPSDAVTALPHSHHLQRLELSQVGGDWRAAFGRKEQVMDWSGVNSLLSQDTRYNMDYFVNSYMFRADAAARIGGYNPRLNSRTSAHEEVDFTARLARSGYTLLFNPHHRAWHVTIGRGGIYRGADLAESRAILEEEYRTMLPEFIQSVTSTDKPK